MFDHSNGRSWGVLWHGDDFPWLVFNGLKEIIFSLENPQYITCSYELKVMSSIITIVNIDEQISVHSFAPNEGNF